MAGATVQTLLIGCLRDRSRPLRHSKADINVTEPACISRAVDPVVEHHGSKSGTLGVIRDDDPAILVRRHNGFRMRVINRGKEKNEEYDHVIHGNIAHFPDCDVAVGFVCTVEVAIVSMFDVVVGFVCTVGVACVLSFQ